MPYTLNPTSSSISTPLLSPHFSHQPTTATSTSNNSNNAHTTNNHSHTYKPLQRSSSTCSTSSISSNTSTNSYTSSSSASASNNSPFTPQKYHATKTLHPFNLSPTSPSYFATRHPSEMFHSSSSSMRRAAPLHFYEDPAFYIPKRRAPSPPSPKFA